MNRLVDGGWLKGGFWGVVGLVGAVTLAGCLGTKDVLTPTPTLIEDYTVGTADSYFMPGGVWELSYDKKITEANLQYSNGVTILHKRIEGPHSEDPSIDLVTPPKDVLQAWSDGWTGLGVHMLIIDDFGVDGVTDEPGDGVHGYLVAATAYGIANRAQYHIMNSGTGTVAYGAGGVRKMFPSVGFFELENSRFEVINLSLGFDPISPGATDAEIDAAIDGFVNTQLFIDVAGFGTYFSNIDDAVITKAAGNESVDARLVVDNAGLLVLNTGPRLLIVGALDGYAQDGNASLDSDSNYAGVIPELQERFLVEYGGSPFAEDVFLCVGNVEDGCGSPVAILEDETVGTSFAAPRVAGYAALVRQKFPNLSGATTASILLDTATYEGLSCYPNCAVTTYGQGRVDIGAALAPVGALQ